MFFVWLIIIIANLAFAAWNIGIYIETANSLSLFVALLNILAAGAVAATPPSRYY